MPTQPIIKCDIQGVYMGGSEFGVVSVEGMRELLLINRDAALQQAHEKSQRFTAIFRRSRVFEKTFQTVLESSNGYVGVPDSVLVGMPEEYYDPYASLQFPEKKPNNQQGRGFTPDYDLEPDDVFERSSFYDD
jgi:hypothetical protein